MSIKLLEMRKAPAESETFNLDGPKLQIFLISNVYNNTKLHPRLLLDMNNTISLWSVLTKKFHDVRTFCNSLTYQFQCIGKHINTKGHLLPELFEWKINTKYKLKIVLSTFQEFGQSCSCSFSNELFSHNIAT